MHAQLRSRSVIVLLATGMLVGAVGMQAAQRLVFHNAGADGSSAQRISCPSPPGFRASKAEQDRAEKCLTAAKVQRMLLTTGATAADVEVSFVPSSQVLGPDRTTRVIAQLDLPRSVAKDFDVRGISRVVALAIGTEPTQVILLDGKLKPIDEGTSDAAPADA